MALKLQYYYNVDTQRFCDSDGSPLALEQLPRITLEQQAILALTCIKDDATAAAFNADDTFSWAADDDWDSSSTVLMQTANANINDVTDWSSANPALGLIGILADADTAGLQTALGTSEELLVHGELKVYALGESKPYYVGQMDFYARNLVDHAGVTPPAVASNYYSKSETDSLLGGYLQQGGPLTENLDADSNKITNLAAGTAPTDAINLGQLTAAEIGADWQESILDQIDFTASEPASPTVGDRYIHSGSSGNSSATTQAMTQYYIYEWNGTDWTETATDEGMTVTDENLGQFIRWNGSIWVNIGTGIDHGSLLNLGTGNPHPQYEEKAKTILSPTSLSANADDYNPTSLHTSNIVRLTASTAVNITGLNAGSDGETLYTHNIGAEIITLTDQDASSSAANRFDLGSSDLQLSPGQVAVLQYDATSARWRAVSGGGGSAATASTLATRTLGAWTDTTANLPAARNGSMLAVIGDYIYMYGGFGGGATNTIYRAAVSAPTTWSSIGTMAIARYYGPNQTQVIGDYVYLFGGYNSSALDSIWRAPTSSPGSMGATGSALPTALFDSCSAVIGDYVYLFGGRISSTAVNVIYRAPTSDPTSWVDTGSTLPGNLKGATIAVIGDYVYLFGGDNGSVTNVIYRAPVSDPTSWTDTTATLPASMTDASLFIVGDYIYIAGGNNGGALNTIYRAPLSDPTSWADTGNTLVSAGEWPNVAIIGENAYIFGDSTDTISSAPITTTYSQGASDPSLPTLTSNPSWLYYVSLWTTGYAVTAFGDNVDAQGNRLTSLADPSSAQDAATKAYVTAAVSHWSGGGSPELDDYAANLEAVFDFAYPTVELVDLVSGCWADLAGSPTRVQGLFGAAAACGTDVGYVLSNDITTFDFNADFSIALWVKTDASSASRHLFGTLDASGYGFRISVSSGGFAEAYNNDAGSATTLTGTTDIDDGAWHLIVVTVSSTTITLYVDGAQEDTDTIAGLSAIAIPGVGGIKDNGTFDSAVTGTVNLGFLAIWNAAIDLAAVIPLYNSGAGRFWR